ncbi:ATP-binding protein [Actinoplanes xinjiangensis]|uniref:ATP-binding protein n=1 Tax=Actinoplanes xinjiangensis TaxID=512350 RepID=UPI00341808BA
MDDSVLPVESGRLVVVNHFDAGVTEVAVRGRWDLRLRSSTARTVRACLAETPRMVLVDLTGLTDRAGESVPTWQAAARYAAGRRPPSDLALCAVPERVRQLLDGTGVRSFDSVRQACATMEPAPWIHRRRAHLPAELRVATAARRLVADACRDWRVSELTRHARLITSELVVNAVEHARTDIVAAVSLRGPLLHLAVQDYTRRLPRLIEHDPDRPGGTAEQRGAGLRLVRAASTSWGALPCTEGKVVWATLTAESRRGA